MGLWTLFRGERGDFSLSILKAMLKPYAKPMPTKPLQFQLVHGSELACRVLETLKSRWVIEILIRSWGVTPKQLGVLKSLKFVGHDLNQYNTFIKMYKVIVATAKARKEVRQKCSNNPHTTASAVPPHRLHFRASERVILNYIGDGVVANIPLLPGKNKLLDAL